MYIIDADEGLIPNGKKLKQMTDKKCDMDAARMIREERALCFVACTRAKEELNIVYKDKPATMLLGTNEYGIYDKVYSYCKTTGSDISEFEKFTERYIPR